MANISQLANKRCKSKTHLCKMMAVPPTPLPPTCTPAQKMTSKSLASIDIMILMEIHSLFTAKMRYSNIERSMLNNVPCFSHSKKIFGIDQNSIGH